MWSAEARAGVCSRWSSWTVVGGRNFSFKCKVIYVRLLCETIVYGTRLGADLRGLRATVLLCRRH